MVESIRPTRAKIVDMLTMIGVGETVQPYTITHLYIKRLALDRFVAGLLLVDGKIYPPDYVYSRNALAAVILADWDNLHPEEA